GTLTRRETIGNSLAQAARAKQGTKGEETKRRRMAEEGKARGDTTRERSTTLRLHFTLHLFPLYSLAGFLYALRSIGSARVGGSLEPGRRLFERRLHPRAHGGAEQCVRPLRCSSCSRPSA